MPITATVTSNLTVVETLDGNRPFAADAKARVTHDVLNTSASLTSGSSPPGTKVAAFQKALAAGAGTIDLTALVGTNGLAVDGTGLRVQAVKVRNPATNANPITLSKGAANGYNGFGADFSLALAPGAHALLVPNDAGSDVGGANKNLDLAGTGTQALDVQVVLG
ncbi:MAG: hypothetical protein FJ290_33220 [Planctomycetes bacterium]|nr:hypothetical protein [Planctomycetota bacterium]